MDLPLGDDDIECNMTIFNERISYAYAISVIRILVSILSIFGSSSIIVTVFVTGKLSSSEVHPLFTLSVGDFILSCSWLFGGSLWLHVTNKPESQGLCYVLSVATTILTLITYLLTVVYALHALLKMMELYRNKGRQPLEIKNTTWKKHLLTAILYLVCWSLPVVLVLPVTESKASLTEVATNSCWCTVDFYNTRPENQRQKGDLNELAIVIASFVGSFYLVTSFLIIAAYVFTLYLAWSVLKLLKAQQLDTKGKKVIKKLLLRATAFIGIFLFCGLPSFVASLLVWNSSSRSSLQDVEDRFVLFWQALVSPLQGILNAIVYGWSRKEFRKALSLPVMRIRFLRKGIHRFRNTPTDNSDLLNVTRRET